MGETRTIRNRMVEPNVVESYIEETGEVIDRRELPTPPAPADTGAGDLIEDASPADTLRELRERVEWYANERTAVMHALVPECPAYPGVPNCCDECVCDCGAADSGQLVRIINDDRTARQQAERERDALLAEREKAGAAWKQGGISPRQKDGSWIMCLGYHEDREEYEWGEVVLKADATALRAQRDAAITLAEEACRVADDYEYVRTFGVVKLSPHAESVRARLATLRGEG